MLCKEAKIRICHKYFAHTEFSERPKDSALRKYNFVNLSNVKNNYKRDKVLRGTTCVWKILNIQQDFVLHAFKSDDEVLTSLISS